MRRPIRFILFLIIFLYINLLFSSRQQGTYEERVEYLKTVIKEDKVS